MIATQINWKDIFSDHTREKMEGWCTEQKAQRVFELVQETDSMVSVEFGVFGAKSLVAIGLGHKEKGSGFVIGIDPWNNKACLEGGNDPKNDEWWLSLDMKAIYESAQYHIAKNELQGYCDTLRFRACDVAVLFPNESIDLIHQDGNHNFQSISNELASWVPKLKVGGIWISDDTDWPEAQPGYALLPSFGLEKIEDHVKWQVWKKVK